MIVPQNGSKLSPIHHQGGIYLFHMNYCTILKENLQVLYKLHPKCFQVAINKLSVLQFLLVEIETYLPMRFFFFHIYWNVVNSKERRYDKSASENNIFHFEHSNKHNFGILCITVSLWKQYNL